MAEIIEFPGADEAYRRNVERIIEGVLSTADPTIRECIKTRVAEMLVKYQKVPPLRVAIRMDQPEAPLLVEALRAHMDEVIEFSRRLMLEICKLQAQLCKCENSQRNR